MNKGRVLTIACAALLLLSACASRPPITASTQGTTLVLTGQVIDVRDTTVKGGRGTGLGSFVGAILGGVAGSKIGSGTGQAIAGIGGAVAGGMAGQRVEESAATSSRTELTVRLDNSGQTRTYRVAAEESFRVGEMVKITTSNGITTVTR